MFDNLIASCTWQNVFGVADGREYIRLEDWTSPVQFFVGRNGSGKTKAALALRSVLDQTLRIQAPDTAEPPVRYLHTDRLISLQSITQVGSGFSGPSGEFVGFPLDQRGIQFGRSLSQSQGMASDAFYVLREHPDIRLKVASLLQRAFGRRLQMIERSGFLDPEMTFGADSYSLLRSEGHGLRELVALLANVYRPDWIMLIVDEPELHLHPSLTRLWMNALITECESSGRRAIVVTHEPRLITPQSCDDLRNIWIFQPSQAPRRVSDAVLDVQRASISGDLSQNPHLASDLVFSPRPVLVEGERDEAAFVTTVHRLGPPASVAQTDFVRCGGSAGVCRWFEIAASLGLDVRAVADLDALFQSPLGRILDSDASVVNAYRAQWQVQKTADVLRPLYDAMNSAAVAAEPSARREWLASVLTSDEEATGLIRLRVVRLLEICRDAGIWLHPQGDLEAVIGSSEKSDAATCRKRCETPTALDRVAEWAAFRLTTKGEIRDLLRIEVERIAQEIQRAILSDPDLQVTEAVGPNRESDGKLVDVVPLGDGRHQLVVKTPLEFRGWSVAFDRSTAPSELALAPPPSVADST